MRWAAHPRAEWYLFGLSFVEAFIFPVAPEIMLAPMTLAKPQRWARYATISLVGSLLGSFVGYALGHFAFHLVRPLLDHLGWLPTFDDLVIKLRALSGWKIFWMLVAAGFLPIPLKIFTWASGFVFVPIPAFVGGMLVGRGKRVFAVSGAIRLGGKRAEAALHRWIEWIGWGLVVMITLLVLYFKFLR
jgi:membrane protein YqaA with SNARE-associated domain